MLTPGFTVIDNAALADALAESVTFTVKLVVPSALGLPVSTPLDDRLIPAGRAAPAATDQVYPLPDPPLAVSVVEG